MWNSLKRLLGLVEKIDLTPFIERGVDILDVRTIQEFNEGHVPGSINIPLDEIHDRIDEIRQLKSPVIACCRTGRRSGIAAEQLKKKGIEIYNGGGWQEVADMMK